MDELIRINFDSDRPTVSGRDLHAALEVKTAYKDWFPRMCDYGFEETTRKLLLTVLKPLGNAMRKFAGFTTNRA